MKRQRKRMSRSEAIVILVIGLLLGTVFTFGEQFWHASVDRRELRSVDAVYQRYRYVQSGGHNSHSSMTLYFENEEPYDIAVECVNDELLQKLDAIAPGTVLHLGVHPNSNTLMEISDHGQPVLFFEQAARGIPLRAGGFLLLGLFLYGGAAYALYALIRGKAR